MNDEAPEVPEGAAIFPLIPEELGIQPLLLVALHATVFFDGSASEVVDDAAADESLQYFVTYLQRLTGPELQRVREDMEVLGAYAREQEWPIEEQQFLDSFLTDYGIADEASS